MHAVVAAGRTLCTYLRTDLPKGYDGGRLRCIKVLGAYFGELEACSQKLVARVRKQLAPLTRACKLRDTRRDKVAMQVQL